MDWRLLIVDWRLPTGGWRLTIGKMSLNFDDMYAYDTVTDAVRGLKSRGYSLDFNLKENCLVCQQHKLKAEDFEIVEYYRFEGPSDPADEAVVYAIESKTGQKGILVNGYGPTSDLMNAEMARKLHVHRN